MIGLEFMKSSEPTGLCGRSSRLIVAVSVLLSITAVTLFCPAGALGQTGGIYDLSWSNFSSGGTAMTTGGPHALATSGGQPDASPDTTMITGGTYQLMGGFLQTADMFPLPVGLSEFSVE